MAWGPIRQNARSCTLVTTTPCSATGCIKSGLRTAPQKGTWGCWLIARWIWARWMVKKASGIKNTVSRTLGPAELGDRFCPWTLMRPHLEYSVQFWPLTSKRALRCWTVFREGQLRRGKGLENLAYKGTEWENQDCLVWRRGGYGGTPLPSITTWKEAAVRWGPGSSAVSQEEGWEKMALSCTSGGPD